MGKYRRDVLRRRADELKNPNYRLRRYQRDANRHWRSRAIDSRFFPCPLRGAPFFRRAECRRK
jgi:hypothetical protein